MQYLVWKPVVAVNPLAVSKTLFLKQNAYFYILKNIAGKTT